MEIVVNENNIRIDKYLSLNTDYSRSSISKLINDGLIKVNNKVIKDSYKIKNNDVILIEEDKIIKPSFTKENIPLDILYEDDYLMVINKPSGLVVHPGSGVENHTLVNALMYHTDNLSDIEGPL
jgi:23S rRNA pseudouridine1911/1915/1917 synthase